MSRLTKKGTRMVNDFREADWYNKLASLEDLEEQLGCPLDVVFKALIDGFYFKKKSKTIFTVGDLGLEYDPNLEKNVFALLITYEDSVLVKDYGKTWFLNESEVKGNEKD